MPSTTPRAACAGALLAVLALAACSSGTPEGERSASPSPQPASASVRSAEAGTYLALGDSLAVGVGATRPAELGYPGLLARRNPALVLRNIAVSGETSTSFIQGGQLSAAVDAIGQADPPVALVTLDIGGNDLLRLRWMEPCASDLGVGCRELVAQTVAAFESNLRRIVETLTDALRDHAPSAHLALLAYPNSFSGTDSEWEEAAELALLGDDGRLDCGATEPFARGVNDVIACVAQEHGAVVVDAYPAFEGRGLDLTHIGAGDIHANDRGYEVIADEFEAVLDGVK